MKISAIIAEFNPFHNGHKYLIEETKKQSDSVVCIMSGSFVQRGDVAIFDKWTRAKSAVLNGADLVIELPAVFASSTAERFAYGAVSLINSLGCVDELSFGSECGDIQKLTDIAKLALNEPAEISHQIKNHLDEGLSYPIAREKAYGTIIDSSILKNPNNILSIEYIKALLKSNSSVKYKTLQRIGDYHSHDAIDNFASASLIRSKILSSEYVDNFIPYNVVSLYKNCDTRTIGNLNNTILYLLRKIDSSYLKEINDVSEGLENALKSASKECFDIESLINRVSGKRYTKTKISRILISVLLDIKKADVYEMPAYARVLAFNDIGRKIIKQIDKNIPTVIKTADYKENNKMFEKDIFATDIAALCTNANKKSGADYFTPPIYLSK